MKTVLITNIPSPYRVTVFDALHRIMGNDFVVFYTSRTHPAFQWKEGRLDHCHEFIGEQKEGLHKKLKALNPSVIITCGFSPVMLKAMCFAWLHRKKLAANTDAWELNEKGYSFLHIWMRKIIYPRMQAFIPVSKKGADNFKRYGLPASDIFISHYAIDNAYSARFAGTEKKFDLLFSGQFIDRKLPFFFCEVAGLLAKEKKDLKVLLLGNGELKEPVMERLRNSKIDFTYGGFVQKEELPALYASCRLFLFPTRLDSWGVVANDACAVGTPVITCTNAGAAGDLVLHGYNGYVLPLDAATWAGHIKDLLEDKEKYDRFSANCLKQIENYNPEESAQAIVNTIRYLTATT